MDMIMKIHRIICCFLIGTVFGCTAGAAGLDYNRTSGEVTVSGDNLPKGKSVRMIVLKKDADYDKLLSGEKTFFESCIHIAELTQTGEDGNFVFPKFTVKSDSPAGEYKVLLNVDNNPTETLILDYASIEQCLEFIEKSADAKEVKGYIDKYNAEVYGLDMGEDSNFARLDETGRLTVFGRLIGTKYTDTASLVARFNKEVDTYAAEYRAAAFAAISNLSTANEVEAAITAYNKIYGIDTQNQLFAGLSVEGKQAVYQKMTGESYSDESGIQLAFNQKVVLYAIETGTWGNIPDYISNYNDTVLHLDLRKYNASNSDMLKYIHTKSLKNVSDLQNAINTYSPSGSSVGGGGGGGGSTSGKSNIKSSGSIISPTVKDSEPIHTEQSPFDDVSSEYWAYPSIKALYEAGVINGKDERIFAPNDNVTRAEAVKMIMSLAGETDTVENGVEFSDVSANSWEHEYVMKASALGIVNGYDDGSFGKGDFVTRQDLCVMIYRLLLKNGVKLENEAELFSDSAEIADYAESAVKSMAGEGIVSGNGDGKFLPKSFATRAETAKIIYSVMKLTK